MESLGYSKRLGVEIKPSTGSFYGKETFDVLIDDVDDITKALNKPHLPRESHLTVRDFCDLVERLNNEKPESCERLLRSWQRVMNLNKQPKWRRFVFKIFGF